MFAFLEPKPLRVYLTPFQRMLIIAISVTATSQLYLAVWAEGFRVSAAAILYPVLLMSLMRSRRQPDTGVVTGIFVMLARTIFDLAAGIELSQALLLEYPGGIFYFCYDCLLCLMIHDRRSVSYTQVGFALCTCDICANALNLILSGGTSSLSESNTLLPLLGLGLFRGCVAALILRFGHYYHQLLQHQEHERRYQRLFIMTAELKNELYFLKKDSEDIEGVMARAYQLYERLGELGVPEEEQALALSIAREVHEIKKDNLRIIRGIEGEVADVYDQEEMHISDLFRILEDSTRRLLGEQRSCVRLICRCEDDVKIIEHYRLLSVIKNLVTNAVEAIQSDRRQGTVVLTEYLKNGDLFLRVADNGPGLTPRAKNNLFKVGYSTKFDPNTGNISRGVGLPAVQFIVEELQGDIQVESTPGKGTTFTVRLPLETIQGDSTL